MNNTELLNPSVENSLNFWAVDGELLPPAVENRNTVLDKYDKWFNGEFTYRGLLEDIPEDYPLINSNWYATAVQNYSSLMNAVPPEFDDAISSDVQNALYSIFLNYFVYGMGVSTAYNDVRGYLRVASIDPRNYWRDDDENQYYVYHKNAGVVVLGKWDAIERIYTVRQAKLNSGKIASMSAATIERVDNDVRDPIIPFTRYPAFGAGELGTSILPVMQPLVEEISASNTRNSYMSAYHGNPILLYMTDGVIPDTKKVGGDVHTDALNKAIGVKLLRGPSGGKMVEINGIAGSDMKYVTSDAAYMGMNLETIKQLEQQLAGIISLPVTLVTAEGKTISGNALRRIYLSPYAVTKRTQLTMLPRVQDLMVLINSVGGYNYAIPQEWLNIFETVDSTGTVTTNRSIEGESTDEDTPGPETQEDINAGLVQQTRPG